MMRGIQWFVAKAKISYVCWNSSLIGTYWLITLIPGRILVWDWYPNVASTSSAWPCSSPVLLSTAQAVLPFTFLSVPSHSSTSGYGWITDPLLSMSQNSAAHQLQACWQPPLAVICNGDCMIHPLSWESASVGSALSNLLIQEQGCPTNTLADHQTHSGRSCLPVPQSLEFHTEQSQTPSQVSSTSAWSLASHYFNSSQMSNSQYIMWPGKDGVNWTILCKNYEPRMRLLTEEG